MPRLGVEAPEKLAPRHRLGRDDADGDGVANPAPRGGEQAPERRLAGARGAHEHNTHALRHRVVELENLLDLQVAREQARESTKIADLYIFSAASE